MRQAQQRLSREQKSQTHSVPAPVGGWNTRDSLAEMDPKDAVRLENFFCTPYDVMLRRGYSQWATGLSGSVNTLYSYGSPQGAYKLFAFAGANLYDVTNQGVVSGSALTGNSSDKFQSVTFGTVGGNFMIAQSGVDLPLVYNGTYWGCIFGTTFNTAVTTLTSIGTLATCTMTVAHNIKTGMAIVIAGFTPVGYNGTYIITVTGANTFTFVLTGALGVTTVTGTATPAVNFNCVGIDPTLFVYPCIFKSRLWSIQKNSLVAWYMPTLSIGGTAQPLDISSLCHYGGYIVSMCDWTLDAGQGMDDYLALITSNGQVVVYKGTDPASATTWALVGVYDIGNPIGRRCMSKYAGDVLIVSMDGLLAMSKALMSTRVNNQAALTDKIQHVISDYTTSYNGLFGWEIDIFPPENMLILNIPTSPTTSIQCVMNTISGAWSLFTGWNANCFELSGNSLYFGTTNAVCLAWNTFADNGTNINFNAQQAFDYLGSSAQLKQIQMIRPVISTDGNPSILFGVNTDFDTSDPAGISSYAPISSNAAIWDANNWDDGSLWGGALTLKKDWQTAFGIGYAISPHMKGAFSKYQLRWLSTDYLYTSGGVI